MKETIDNFINPNNITNGLLIADMPTGYGKTYTASRSIYDYIYKFEGQRKIFFITTLKKNFPENELKSAYKKHDNLENFNKDVLIIKSNFDYIYENLLDAKIPDKFKFNSYFELESKVKMLKQLGSNDNEPFKLVKSELAKSIREDLEYNFRKDVIRIIKDNLPKSALKKIEVIRNNEEYQWIGKIYPTVFMNDYKIYLLTIDKFLVKNTVLVEPAYYFINNSIINDSIIFIDEFDAGKETVEKKLIKKALSTSEDYIKLFLCIYRSFNNHKFSRNILDICDKNKITNEYRYKFEDLKKECNEIFNEFKLEYNYKTRSEGINRKQSFLFNDSSFHTMLRNNCNYIRATLEEVENQVSIFFEGKESYYENRKESDIIIYSLVRKISSFLNRFRIMILNLGNEFSNSINSRRDEKEDEFTLENAIKTITSEFLLNEKQRNLLMNDLSDHRINDNNNENLIQDITFYNNGFKYFEFKDSDEHLNETIFNFINIYDTPEKIIAYLSKKAKVIGISATADINTVTGNYDLDYLSSVLKENLKFIPNEVYERIKMELECTWDAYKCGKVNVNTSIINLNKGNLDINLRLEEIFQSKKLANRYSIKLINKCGGVESSDYIIKRYCNIFAIIKEFVIHDDIKSFLCLNMVLPKRDIINFDLELFETAISDLAKIYNKSLNSGNIYVLKSENFDIDKENVLKRLSNNEKILIMSSYNTIGAGQNLQYEYQSLEGLIQIADGVDECDSRIKYKDIDAIFLGDITNIAVNMYNTSNIDEEALLKYFFQIEYLYENDEISYRTLDNLIKIGFNKYSKNNEYSNYYIDIKNTMSIKRQSTRDVIQALGRMSRTFVKNSNIYIYTVEELVGKVDVGCLHNKILTPDMKSFVKLVDGMGYRYNEDEKKILNRAERISSKGKTYIMGLLSRGWSNRSMALWKSLREIVLKYPTANEEEYQNNELIKNLYICGYKDLKKYLYAQKGDFSDTIIEFFIDKELFKNEDRCKDRYVAEVSENDARLTEIFKYSGIENYFNKMGYSTCFKENKYILSPVLFNNIYKGAIGEVVGSFIFEKELGIKLREIEEEDKFEFFDYEITEGVYVDFKHWKQSYREENSREKAKNEIERKLEAINGNRVYIINIIADGDFSIHKQNDGKIIEIPYLINSNGEINEEALEILREEISGDNN